MLNKKDKIIEDLKGQIEILELQLKIKNLEKDITSKDFVYTQPYIPDWIGISPGLSMRIACDGGYSKTING